MQVLEFSRDGRMSGTWCKSVRTDSTECQLKVRNEDHHPVVSTENSPPQCWLRWLSHSGTPPCGSRWSSLQVHRGPPGCVGVCVALWWKPRTVCVSPRLPGGRVGREPQISEEETHFVVHLLLAVPCIKESQPGPQHRILTQNRPQPSHTGTVEGASRCRGEITPRFRFQLCNFGLSGPKTQCLEKATAGESGVEHYNTVFLCRHMFTAHSKCPLHSLVSSIRKRTLSRNKQEFRIQQS